MHCADSRSLIMVTAKFFLSMHNVLCHCSRSADVICNVLEKNINYVSVKETYVSVKNSDELQ